MFCFCADVLRDLRQNFLSVDMRAPFQNEHASGTKKHKCRPSIRRQNSRRTFSCDTCFATSSVVSRSKHLAVRWQVASGHNPDHVPDASSMITTLTADVNGT